MWKYVVLSIFCASWAFLPTDRSQSVHSKTKGSVKNFQVVFKMPSVCFKFQMVTCRSIKYGSKHGSPNCHRLSPDNRNTKCGRLFYHEEWLNPVFQTVWLASFPVGLACKTFFRDCPSESVLVSLMLSHAGRHDLWLNWNDLQSLVVVRAATCEVLIMTSKR